MPLNALHAAVVIGCLAPLSSAQSLLFEESTDGITGVGPTMPLSGIVAPRTGANDFSFSAPRIVLSAAIDIAESASNPWDGSLTYTILGDASGIAPSSEVFAQGVAGSFTRETVFDGPGSIDVVRLSFDFEAPASLGAGDYWLAIMPTQAEGAGGFEWSVMDNNGVTALSVTNDFSSWSLQQGEAGFQLFGEIPSPGGAALFVGACVFSRRRR